MYSCTWKERYLLSLTEEMTAKQIMQLRGVNRKEALKIRLEALEYCRKNGIKVIGKKVPTDAILKTTGKDVNYYYTKMEMEAKAKE